MCRAGTEWGPGVTQAHTGAHMHSHTCAHTTMCYAHVRSHVHACMCDVCAHSSMHLCTHTSSSPEGSGRPLGQESVPIGESTVVGMQAGKSHLCTSACYLTVQDLLFL